jgi:alpha-galactosidase
VQAYRRGIELIRRVAGERFLLGCGAPFLPSVGLVDGMRIGSDVAPFWRAEGDRHETGPALVNALRSTLAHGWMHRRWWVNDPDCVLVRERDSWLTPDEVRAWASVVALSGGMVLVSDDLSRLEPERLAVLARLFPPLGRAAEALPPVVDDIPERLRLPIERPWGRWWIVGLANWADHERPARFDPADWGLPDGAYHLVDLWSGTHRGPTRGPVDLGTLAPHGLHLLAVHPALARPHLVGSTGHLLGEAMDVEEERWDGRALTLALSGPRSHRGELLVYVPDGFVYLPSDGDPSGLQQRGRLLRVPFTLARPGFLSLSFGPEPA